MAIVDARSYSVQELLKHHSLHIPLYQRPYVWGDAAVKLLDDIFEAFENKDPSLDSGYFIGNILLIKAEGGLSDEYDLADGQQRLTTLLILLGQLQARVLASPSNSGHHSKATYTRDFLLLHRPGHDKVVTVIQSPHKDVQSLLLQLAQGAPLKDEVETKTSSFISSRLIRAYLQVADEVGAWLKRQKVSVLGDFLSYILREVEMVVLKCTNQSVALEVFEGLNSTGAKLVQADLLKSAFMKQVPPSKWEAVDADWTEILKVVGNKRDGEDSFLRTASMAVLFPAFSKPSEAPRRTELLRRISSHCELEKIAVDVLLSKMSTFAKNRTGILSESPVYPGSVEGQVLSRLRRLPKMPDFLVTLLAVLPSELSTAAKEHIARSLEALACVIAVARQSKNINYAVQPFCVQLRALVEADVSRFCTELSNSLIRPNLASFYNQLKLMRADSAKHKAWIRYLLWVVEDYFREGLGATALDYSIKTRGARKAHLEHIIPQSREDIEASILHQIGNITLLEPTKNTSIGAGDFPSKKPQYACSEFFITAELTGRAHGDKTKARLFLDSAWVRPLWDYATFDETDIAVRTEAIFELLLAYWGLLAAGSVPESMVEVEPELEEVAHVLSDSAPKTPVLVSPAGKTIDVGSRVTIQYGESSEYTFKVVNSAHASSNGELFLNLQKEGRDLLGLSVGDVIEGRLFNLTPSRIEILAIS